MSNLEILKKIALDLQSKKANREELERLYDDLMQLYYQIKDIVYLTDKNLYEQWKAGGFLISDDIVSMYPSLSQVIEQITFEESEEKESNFRLTSTHKQSNSDLCSITADDFDWIQFSKDLRKKGNALTTGDFDPDGNSTDISIPIQTKSPIDIDINKLSEEYDLYNFQSLKKSCPNLLNAMLEKVQEHTENIVWEIESSTTPTGYHGTFTTTYILVELENLGDDDIEIIDLTQDNGIVSMEIVLELPYKYRQYEDSYA